MRNWETLRADRERMLPSETPVVAAVESAILTIRGCRVLLDADLAPIYGVTVKALNQAVKRNQVRFPTDFMFQLTVDEAKALRSQFVTSKGRGGSRYRPRAFTERGVAMLSSVLRSEKLARKLDALEKKYDAQFRVVFDAIRDLMTTPSIKPRRRIGFRVEKPSQ